MKMKSALAILAIAALGASSQAAFFDWENTTNGSASSLSQTNDGLTATATSPGGLIESFDMSSQTGFGGFGTHSLIGYFEGGTRPQVKISFSMLVTNVLLEVGDNSTDDDLDIVLTAYDSDDNALVSVSYSYGTAVGPISLGVGAPNIAYVIGKTTGGVGGFANSVVWDNVTATPVPEPATLAMLGLGTAAILRRRARR